MIRYAWSCSVWRQRHRAGGSGAGSGIDRGGAWSDEKGRQVDGKSRRSMIRTRDSDYDNSDRFPSQPFRATATSLFIGVPFISSVVDSSFKASTSTLNPIWF